MRAASTPVLALDIGGTKLAVGVVTDDGAVHGMLVEPTRRDDGPEAVIARLFEMGHRAADAAERLGVGPVRAVGISCGGPLDALTGVLTHPLHLPGWIDVPIVELARRTYGVPAVLENDATAAALAEHRFGGGRGTTTMLYLTISTGIGGGAVIGGRLHRGAAGNGGEYGHIMVRPGGRLCLCGRLGCLEAYASGTSIGARASERLVAGEPSVLTGPVTAQQVSAAARAGDVLARAVWDETTAVLGQAVTDLVNIVEPELVVLGGGVTRSGAALLDPVAAIVARDAMVPAAAASRVELAQLGDAVCVVGAGALAHDLLEEPAHV